MDKFISGNPYVSVILPVYNGSGYLKEAIASILNQTYNFFELIIIDDGSSDRSLDVIKAFNDERIKLVRNKKNEGLIGALNKGINFSKGEFILRMDADDIAIPVRLEKQVDFMMKNEDVVVCGSWFETFGKMNRIIKYPIAHDEIYLNLLLTCPIGHPTAIIRSEVLKENNLYYDEDFKHSEDSNLWVRISEFGKLANIPEVLLRYRTHEDQITNKHYHDVTLSFNKTRNLLFKKICIQMMEQNIIIPFPETEITLKHVFLMEKIIIRMIKKNRFTRNFNNQIFEKSLGRLWLEIYNHAKQVSFIGLIKIIKSPLIGYSQMVNYYWLILLKKWLIQ